MWTACFFAIIANLAAQDGDKVEASVYIMVSAWLLYRACRTDVRKAVK